MRIEELLEFRLSGVVSFLVSILVTLLPPNTLFMMDYSVYNVNYNFETND